MKITYYGTGSSLGVPEPFCSCRVCEHARSRGGRDIRTRSQATVDHLMIDCPVDCLLHTLYYGLDMRKYRHVLITHTHFDHYFENSMLSRYTDESNWTFYLPAPSAEAERTRTQTAVAACKTNPPRRAPDILESALFTPMEIGGAKITPLPAQHEKKKGAVLYLIQNGGKALLWVHDSGFLPDETIAYLKEHPVRLDAVSLDCTLARGQRIASIHMDILQCAETRKLLMDIGCADENTKFMLSHIGHLCGQTYDEMCEEAREFGFIVAYDRMEIEV